MDWMIASTWSVSFLGCGMAAQKMKSGCSAMEAIQALAASVELDPDVDNVGYAGFPNYEGEVELDAACMDGKTMKLGAVAGMKGYANPFEIAVRVMKESPPNLLVGAGAEEFAARMGFSQTELLTEANRKEWIRRRLEMDNSNSKPGETAFGHDTVGIVALDLNGDMAAGTSTSGLAMKMRGRVGDSPLAGSGFYVDNDIGGAVATGVGEEIMKGCLSFHTVELMRQGLSPLEAATSAVRRLHARLERTGKPVGNMAVVCADRFGCHAAAANHEGFAYVAATAEEEPAIHNVNPCCGLPGL
jgi:N4-(beta-N-acetylglucosaminyl)-L-asparaginase